jgi:hypothetical protein
MRLLASIALGLLLALSVSAEARRRTRKAQDPQTVGLGRSCGSDADCGHKTQRCLTQSDANGKPLSRGLCVLPCGRWDEGLRQADFDATVDGGPHHKPPKPRCPARFECRSAGAGVPIDLCTRQ